MAESAGAVAVAVAARGRSEEPAFSVGDAVRVRDLRRPGHTRCPWYLRGRTGVIVRFDGAHSLPDVEAHSAERVMEPTYCVRFEAAELWDDGSGGSGGDGGDGVVHVDLWESYLEAAS